MFSHIQHKRIIVTGPQRSGTTICAHMISHDTGLEYIDEDRIGVDNLSLARNLFSSHKNCVLQAPALARHCHELDVDLVVFMIRPVADIIKSQKRIGWGCETIELSRYGVSAGPIAQVKYDYWRNVQRSKVKNYREINYNDLTGHKLFEHNRMGFSARQWQREQK